MPSLFLVTNEHAQGPDKLAGIFLTEQAARAFIVPGVFGLSYEKMRTRGGVVEMAVTEAELRKIEKSGVVYVACAPLQTSAGFAVPIRVSSSKSGLVKKAAAAGDYYRTAIQLFDDTPLAGAYLLEGYSMPPGYRKFHAFSGPLIDKIPAPR